MQLPVGWTQAHYEWLRALGTARDPAPLLREHREWQRAEWVRARLDALTGLTPDAMRQYLPAVRGLIAVADRAGELETRCYARERLLELHNALFDLQGIAPVMAQLERLLPQASRVRRARGGAILASLYQAMGALDQALLHIRTAADAAAQLGDAELQGRCAYVQATIHYQQGALDEGVNAIQRARRYAEKLNAPTHIAECWNFEGVLRRARGEYDLALNAYRRARTLFERADQPLGVARAIANIGLVYWTMGLLEDARLHYREAMPRFQQLGAEWDVATCTLNTAILLQQEDDLQGALELYRDALRRYETLGDQEGVAYCLQNLADAARQAKQYDQAVNYAHRAAALATRQGNARLSMQARHVKAQALLAQNRPREALQTLQAARPIAQQAPLHAIRQAYFEGEAHARLGRPDPAHQAFQTCLQQLAQIEALRGALPEEISLYLSQFREMVAAIVGYYGRQGEWRRAFESCQRGKGVALRLAWDAPRVYPELSRAEQQRLNALRQRYENALAQQNRARTPAEQRRLRRETERHLTAWRNYQRALTTRYPRLRWRQPEPLPPEQLPLNQQTLLVEYALAPDHITIVWARRRNGRVQIGGSVQRVPHEQLRAAIQNLLDALEREAPIETVHQQARRLYQWLIRPIEAQLGKITHLIVCPDGDLHAMPWAVLLDAQGRYLIERVALGACPSASAWATAEQMARGRPAQGRALIAAVSEFSGALGETRARLSRLPGATREAQTIQRVWGPSVQTLYNQQATRDALTTQMPTAAVLHLATHAVPNLRMPMLSALALWGRGAPQWFYAHEMLQVRLSARLAVLSACRTGVGVNTADGALGLHWAFLAAGCPTVLATLWQLPDDAAPLWTEAFYTQYKTGDAPIDALRRACLKLRTNPRFAHPRYWGAWQAFGAR